VLTPLELLQNAVADRDFAGVKLYPPMGFRPIGNADLPASKFVPKSKDLKGEWDNFPKELDRVLHEFYRWCADKDVPIKTHTSPSQSPTRNAEARSDPVWWGRVLECYPGLRLNLGHLGGLNAKHTGRMDTVLRLMDQYDRVYADLADYEEVTTERASDVREVNWLFDYFKSRASGARPKIAARKLWSRLMYGSDWLMLGRAPKHGEYLKGWHRHLRRRAIPEGAQRLFFGENALRYMRRRITGEAVVAAALVKRPAKGNRHCRKS
jgi:predicted TIM-barrel fold metal-dependent hydrolase